MIGLGSGMPPGSGRDSVEACHSADVGPLDREGCLTPDLDGLLPKSEPLLGTLHFEWKKCGNPACRCARGEPHGPYAYRHWRENGRQRKVYVARDRISEVLARIENRKRLAAPPWRVRQVLAGLWRIEKEVISWPAT